jgi:hypothetical protein
MKISSLHRIVSVVSLLALATVTAAERPVVTVAVFDFESKDEPVRDLGPKAANLINAALSSEERIITVERAEIDKVLSEQELGLSGTITPATAGKVGNLVGAKVLITGRVFKVDKDLVIVAKIIGVETGRVYGETVQGGGPAALTDLSQDLSRKISSLITKQADTLVAKSEPREERVQKLVKSVKRNRLPAVSVKIHERHFGQPAIDPAAQTEFLLLLQQAGFVIVDDNSKQRADIEVTGEAFSALALRKGNLNSCRSRVEIKAHDLNARKLLLVDRQTSVAVDSAEQIAAKTSLQNAVLELAERVLPQLSKQ